MTDNHIPPSQTLPNQQPPPRCPTALAHLESPTPTPSEFHASKGSHADQYDFSTVRRMERVREGERVRRLQRQAEEHVRDGNQDLEEEPPGQYRPNAISADVGGRRVIWHPHTPPGCSSYYHMLGTSAGASTTDDADNSSAPPPVDNYTSYPGSKGISPNSYTACDGHITPPAQSQLPELERGSLGTPLPQPDPRIGEIHVFEYPDGLPLRPKANDKTSSTPIAESSLTTSSVRPYRQLSRTPAGQFFDDYINSSNRQVSSQEYSARQYQHADLERPRSCADESKRPKDDENSISGSEKYVSFPRDKFTHAFVESNAGGSTSIDENASLPRGARYRFSRRPLPTPDEPAFPDTSGPANNAAPIYSSHYYHVPSGCVPLNTARVSESTTSLRNYTEHRAGTERSLNVSHPLPKTTSLTSDEAPEYGSPAHMRQIYNIEPIPMRAMEGIPLRGMGALYVAASSLGNVPVHLGKSTSETNRTRDQDKVDVGNDTDRRTSLKLRRNAPDTHGLRPDSGGSIGYRRQAEDSIPNDLTGRRGSYSHPERRSSSNPYAEAPRRRNSLQDGESNEDPSKRKVQDWITRHQYARADDSGPTVPPPTIEEQSSHVGRGPLVNIQQNVYMNRDEHVSQQNPTQDNFAETSHQNTSSNTTHHGASAISGHRPGTIRRAYSHKMESPMQKGLGDRRLPHSMANENSKRHNTLQNPKSPESGKPGIRFAPSPMKWEPPRGPTPWPVLGGSNTQAVRPNSASSFHFSDLPSYSSSLTDLAPESSSSRPVTPPFPPLFHTRVNQLKELATASARSAQAVDRSQIRSVDIREERGIESRTVQKKASMSYTGLFSDGPTGDADEASFYTAQEYLSNDAQENQRRSVSPLGSPANRERLVQDIHERSERRRYRNRVKWNVPKDPSPQGSTLPDPPSGSPIPKSCKNSDPGLPSWPPDHEEDGVPDGPESTTTTSSLARMQDTMPGYAGWPDNEWPEMHHANPVKKFLDGRRLYHYLKEKDRTERVASKPKKLEKRRPVDNGKEKSKSDLTNGYGESSKSRRKDNGEESSKQTPKTKAKKETCATESRKARLFGLRGGAGERKSRFREMMEIDGPRTFAQLGGNGNGGLGGIPDMEQRRDSHARGVGNAQAGASTGVSTGPPVGGGNGQAGDATGLPVGSGNGQAGDSTTPSVESDHGQSEQPSTPQTDSKAKPKPNAAEDPDVILPVDPQPNSTTTTHESVTTDKSAKKHVVLVRETHVPDAPPARSSTHMKTPSLASEMALARQMGDLGLGRGPRTRVQRVGRRMRRMGKVLWRLGRGRRG